LPHAPLVLGRVAIAGSCGWYDYSFAQPWVVEQLGVAALASKQLGQMAWTDGYLVAFRRGDGSLMEDGEVARVMEEELGSQLEELDRREDVDHVVAVTHHQPFFEVVYRTGTLPWEFFCAFMGSRGLGERIQRSKKVRAAIYGHSHVVNEHHVDGLRVFGTALGYPRERRNVGPEELLATRIGWVEVG
jgi:hypothetical protein